MKRVMEVPWTVRQAVGIFLIAWIGIPLLIWGLLNLLAPVAPLTDHWLKLLESGDIAVSFVIVVINSLVGMLLINRVLKRYGASWQDLGLRKVSIGKAIVLVLGVILAFLLLVAAAFALLSLLFPHFNANQSQVNEFTSPHTTTALRLSFLALVVIPPPIEEIFFRGFIFPALTKRWGIIGGAIITSILFALAHWQLNVSIYTLVLSLLLCFLYYKLRSLWPGIFVHMLNNYVAFTALIHK